MSDQNKNHDAYEDPNEQPEEFGELSEDDLEDVAGGWNEWGDDEGGEWLDGGW